MAIVGFAMMLVGVILYFLGTTVTLPSCWGHFGCDYLVRTFDSRAYAGMFLIVCGMIGVFEGIFWGKRVLVTKIIGSIFGLMLMLSVCEIVLSQYHEQAVRAHMSDIYTNISLDTGTWQLYQDIDVGFSIAYPANLSPRVRSDASNVKDIYFYNKTGDNLVTLDILSATAQLSAEDFLKLAASNNNARVGPITFGGITRSFDSTHHKILFVQQNMLFTIAGLSDASVPLLKQMVATFRFSTTTASPSRDPLASSSVPVNIFVNARIYMNQRLGEDYAQQYIVVDPLQTDQIDPDSYRIMYVDKKAENALGTSTARQFLYHLTFRKNGTLDQTRSDLVPSCADDASLCEVRITKEVAREIASKLRNSSRVPVVANGSSYCAGNMAYALPTSSRVTSREGWFWLFGLEGPVVEVNMSTGATNNCVLPIGDH